MIGTYAPGAQYRVGQDRTPFFAATPAAQTISPVAPTVGLGGTIIFTTNLPGKWTATGGTIVAAADGLSATFTAPGSPGSVTVMVTNLNDPGNLASTIVHVTSFGPTEKGDFVPDLGVNRSFVGTEEV